MFFSKLLGVRGVKTGRRNFLKGIGATAAPKLQSAASPVTAVAKSVKKTEKALMDTRSARSY